jgi:sec-independent protein translocase protein TatA
MTPVVAEIIGWEFLLVIGLVALLFGSSQIPKFARSIGEASREFRRGIDDGVSEDEPSEPVPAEASPSEARPAGESPTEDGPTEDSTPAS